jgi:phospholipid/cholesterol/gamma-HCH transport system permease protein
MQQIGVRSLFIVCLVSFLIGAILVLQTADQFEKFGSKHFVAPTVCISIIRELGPLMTAIVIAGRVGAAFTAGIGSMVINEEVLALRTMGINPTGYLVAPRLIAIGIMLPCLTAFSYIMGLLGGLTAAVLQFRIPASEYIIATQRYIHLTDLSWGLVKGFVFACLICMVACRQALTVRGGPEGVGRNTMISVVTSLVSIIVADAVIGMFLSSVVYPS